ncbi:MAG: chloramphenicol phosphotransferase [Pseudomonadota bacterium]
MTARVIILNGVSSAGKTTLAKAIQSQSDTTILHVEMDKFLSFLPDGDEFKPEWFRLDKVEGPLGRLPRISNGPQGEKLLGAMRRFVVEAGNKGLDLVVDEVCHAREIADYRAGLKSCRAVFVKVFAPLSVIEAREKARGDRLIGLAREQSSRLHRRIEYDLEVDTSAQSPEECAETILKLIQ